MTKIPNYIYQPILEYALVGYWIENFPDEDQCHFQRIQPLYLGDFLENPDWFDGILVYNNTGDGVNLHGEIYNIPKNWNGEFPFSEKLVWKTENLSDYHEYDFLVEMEWQIAIHETGRGPRPLNPFLIEEND